MIFNQVNNVQFSEYNYDLDRLKNANQTLAATIRPNKKKICNNDPSHKAKQWRKDPFEKVHDLCFPCYRKALANKQSQEGKVCSIDPSHTAIQWCKDPLDKTRDLCNACYIKALRNKPAQEGRVCSKNPSYKAIQWCEDPADKTRDPQACYDVFRSKKRKFSEADSEERFGSPQAKRINLDEARFENAPLQKLGYPLEERRKSSANGVEKRDPSLFDYHCHSLFESDNCLLLDPLFPDIINSDEDFFSQYL